MVQLMSEVKLYIDGSSRGNPGPSGVGIVLIDNNGKEVGVFSEQIGRATNNQAEYTALLYAVEIIKILDLKDAIIYTDSELLFKQIYGKYRVKNDKIRNLLKAFFNIKEGLNIEVLYLERESNARADILAKDASYGLVRNTIGIKLSQEFLYRKGD
jgi:ribonuclease HI